MTRAVAVEAVAGWNNEALRHARAADTNHDERVSVDELDAYLARLDAATKRVGPNAITAEEYSQARRLLGEVRTQVLGLWTASPEEQRRALQDALTVARQHAQERDHTLDANFPTGLADRAQALGYERSQAEQIASIAWGMLCGIDLSQTGPWQYETRTVVSAAYAVAKGESEASHLYYFTDNPGSQRARSPYTPAIERALANDLVHRLRHENVRDDRGGAGEARRIAMDAGFSSGARADTIAIAAVRRMGTPAGESVVRNLVMPPASVRANFFPSPEVAAVRGRERAEVAEAIVRNAPPEKLSSMDAATAAYLLIAMQGQVVARIHSQAGNFGFFDPRDLAYGTSSARDYRDSVEWSTVQPRGAEELSVDRRAAIRRLLENLPGGMRIEAPDSQGLYTRIRYSGREVSFRPEDV